MAHLLLWPGTYCFYPIGSTSATCLTRDISPDEPAHVLSLGCGDPRNILYTVYSESPSQSRKLDFTCCDIDPGVLARNVLLFSMILDGKVTTNTMWNIFFHFYVDKDSHSALVRQCTKLISHSKTTRQWNISPYGSLLRMCTDYTLQHLRRHWTLYAEMQNLPSSRLESLRKAFTDRSKANMSKSNILSTGARSVGPAFILSQSVIYEQFAHYWKNGTTFTDKKDIDASTFLNPTFVYSLGGEGCFVDCETDPIVPFHHAALFGNANDTPTMVDLINSAKASFNDWCSSFKDHSSHCVLRFFLGEATAVCAALAAYAETGSLDDSIPTMQWTTSPIRLNGTEYVVGSAPTTFNVIDTSNLEDHIGLLHVIIATAPLLSRSTPSSTLYTESLIFRGQGLEDATRHFQRRLCTDITIAGLLFGVCPVDYLSNFSSYGSTCEVLMQQASKNEVNRLHSVTTWKSTTSGDVLLAQNAASTIDLIFEPLQLGALFYNIYHTMYEQEYSAIEAFLKQPDLSKTIDPFDMVHYSCETFALMLKLIKKNLQITPETWLEAMGHFVGLHSIDKSMPLEMLNQNDLCVQLYRHSLYIAPFYRKPVNRNGVLSLWHSIPPIARVHLTVPRSALGVLENSEAIGTPPFQCRVKCQSGDREIARKTYSSIRVAFGRVIPIGTFGKPCVRFEEDEKGWKGTSPLVVSFVISSFLMTDTQFDDTLSIQFGVRSMPDTTSTVHLMSKLGMELVVFSAKVTDKNHVVITPEDPLLQRTISPSPAVRNTHLSAEIGASSPVKVELDKRSLVSSFTCRVSIENDELRRAFEAGQTSSWQIAQISPCVMRLTLSGYKQDIAYPFPVAGNRNKLRLERKSLYMEVVVPVFGPFETDSDGMKLTPFPVIRTGHHLIPWNIHRVNLSSLPALDIKANNLGQWFNTHVSSMMMMSVREQYLLKKRQDNTLMRIKDTLHTIFVRAVDTQGGFPTCLFSLHNEATKSCDTIFFISDLRYDLHSHTILCDGYVLSLTNVVSTLVQSLDHLLYAPDMVNITVYKDEMQAWKQLLPAFVERCRSWNHGPNCEYEIQGNIPLSKDTMFDPLCSCGRGKDIEGMKKVALWNEYAPYVTRLALSPLFAVSYMTEPIGHSDELAKYGCSVCHGKGKPKMLACGACKKVQYCGSECQKKDWKTHKPQCKVSCSVSVSDLILHVKSGYY